MINTKPKEIKTKTIVILVLLYTAITNIGDIKTGMINGWNAVGCEEHAKPYINEGTN